MRWFYTGKDGGKESPVTGFWLFEIKKLFSFAILKFNPGCRENFHSHAFNSISWLIKGKLTEELKSGEIIYHKPSINPIFTYRSTFHKVSTKSTSYAITLRGPWDKSWKEYNKIKDELYTLESGRKITEVR